jgi:hypothetical protein
MTVTNFWHIFLLGYLFGAATAFLICAVIVAWRVTK